MCIAVIPATGPSSARGGGGPGGSLGSLPPDSPSLGAFGSTPASFRCFMPKGAAFFPNEFSAAAAVRRGADETPAAWRTRAAYAAAEWYYEHLGGQKPLVIVTEDREVVARLANRRIEIFVLTLGDYLDRFFPDCRDVAELYRGVAAARDAAAKEEKASSADDGAAAPPSAASN